MKAIFLVDATPNIEMFAPVIIELPSNVDSLVINLDRWTIKAEIEEKLQELGVKYRTIDGWSQRDVNRILTEIQPNVIVMSHDATIPVDPLFIDCANSMHIPTLYVPHGMLSSITWTGWNAPGFRNWLLYLKMAILGVYRLMRLDKLSRKRLVETGWMWIEYTFRHKIEGYGEWSKAAVFGDASKQALVSAGISPDRIVVTGNPKFDYIFHSKGTACKAKVCQRYQIPNDKDIILLLTDYLVECGQWKAEQRIEFVIAIYKTTLRLTQSKLIIKLHPAAEKEADYQDIVKDLPEPPVICQDVPLWELLQACSLAITTVSGAGLEAMAAGKPLVVVNLFGDQAPFDETSGAIIVHKESDLLPALETILCQGLSEEKKKTASKFVYRHAYLQDGKAAKRIADLIVQMATENKDRSIS